MKNIINKVYIVPDYQATSNDHWYPWLSRQLKNVGVDSKRIMLANPFQPDLEEWQQNLKLHIPHLDEHTFLVAHGLSGLSVLSFLQQHYLQQHRKTGGVMLISSNDPFVPAPVSLRLAHSLNAQIFEIKKAGHFNKCDGFTEFPQLLEIMKLCLANEPQNAANL
ncbi:RBBP9/YdeN family alpha/beta hydrolase [Acinetobacter pseudolwoffii]|uniref:RBBP9/YdeN family alpha/beta hydrolase n=1 Tax=Acinetobacter pseudolwoffii TaxID=2053287 RepID=UPI0025791ECF|nr:alpha/beta hydrolase [Acinetobacter pseudolwoffii]MDM1324106.1 serine hydrolase family protein [Acinetobacter pseudolwoffii]